ncbi:Zip1p PWA37_004839 [Arxiozyma heterogenica]|uniref:Zip1p n=1 Tax=Arxiozyma heterogenica TaxID=278026 RepID=UPI002F09CE35
MSNFFRDSSLGFKSRSNIFSKFKNKETSLTNTKSNQTNISLNEDNGHLSFIDDEADTSITNTLMLISKNNSNSGLTNTHGDSDQTTQQTSDESIVLGPSQKVFFSSTPINNNQNNTNYSLNNVNSIKMSNAKNQINTEPINDDDDFEITEVREIDDQKDKISLPNINDNTAALTNNNNQLIAKTVTPTRSNKEITSSTMIDISNSSSNDVLLEAFTNTQRICSNLKQELILKQSENSKMKIKLNSCENDINKVNIKIESFKKQLAELENKSRKLLSQKETDNGKIRNLKKEYETSKKIVNGYRDDIILLKTLLNKIQDSKRDIEIESTKRAKEIEYLKRELDDCSGQLSEEKIKNGSLTHELGTFKNEIVGEIKQLTELSWDDFLKKNMTNNKEFFDNLNNDLKNNSKTEFEKILTTIEDNDGTLFERLGEEYNIILKSLNKIEANSIQESRSISDTSSSLKQIIIENINFAKKALLHEILKGNETSINSFNNSFLEITKNNQIFSDQIQQMCTQFGEYQEKLILSKEYEQTIKDLEMEICSLKQQINENMSLIGIKDAQLEENSSTYTEQNSKLVTYKQEEEKLMILVNQNNIKLEKCEQELSYYQNLLNTEKANFDNKLASQNEINSAIISENETLKQRLQELQSYKTTWEQEQESKLEKFQKINDQFQKLNVETIQLKAHELELEEENRNLRKSIESNKESFQENISEIKFLRQNIASYNTERQEFIAEKLCLQDKNEECHSIIKQLKAEVTWFKDKMKNLEQNNYKKDVNAKENNSKTNDTQYHKERSNSIFLQTQILKDPIKKNILQQNKINNQRKKTSRNKIEKNHAFEINGKKKSMDDEFELSFSSTDDLELTNSSLLYVKPLNPKIKMTSRKENKKKLLLVDDFDLEEPISKKTNLNKRIKK